MSRVILTNELRVSMLNVLVAQQIRTTIVDPIEVEIELDQEDYVNAFGNERMLPIINKALNMKIAYSKKEITLEIGDVLYIPVIENNALVCWFKLSVTDQLFRKR